MAASTWPRRCSTPRRPAAMTPSLCGPAPTTAAPGARRRVRSLTRTSSPGQNHNHFPSLAIEPDGYVMTVWHRGACCNVITTTNKIAWARSTNGGVTFPVSGTIATVPRPSPSNLTASRPPGSAGPTRPTSPPTPAPMASSTPVWTAFRVAGQPDTAGVYLARTTDSGVNWTAPVLVDNSQPAKFQVFPWVTVSLDHVVHVTYTAAAPGPGGPTQYCPLLCPIERRRPDLDAALPVEHHRLHRRRLHGRL